MFKQKICIVVLHPQENSCWGAGVWVNTPGRQEEVWVVGEAGPEPRSSMESTFVQNLQGFYHIDLALEPDRSPQYFPKLQNAWICRLP